VVSAHGVLIAVESMFTCLTTIQRSINEGMIVQIFTSANSNNSDMTPMGVGRGGLCTKVFSTSITAYNPVAFTTSSTNSIGETTTYIDSLDRSATDNATILSSGTMTMAAMVVYWQESDLKKFDPEYAATLADHLSIGFTPTATSDITSETATPPNRSQLPSATSNLGEAIAGSKGSGLSSGAKAGIGVGVGVGTLLVALAGFLLYKRRVGRREKKLDRNSAIQNQQPEFVQRASQMQTA
jgi:hypothetical protein